jgi:hypothetical protein
LGRIEIKNGEINWKQFAEDYERNLRSFTTMKDFEGSKAKRSLTNQSNSRYSKLQSQGKASEFAKDELTARTPYTNVASKGSRLSHAFNMANPNPQNGDWIFKGARDVGYRKYFEGKNPLTDVVRFGKKVDYYSKVSNDQLMQDHLR